MKKRQFLSPLALSLAVLLNTTAANASLPINDMKTSAIAAAEAGSKAVANEVSCSPKTEPAYKVQSLTKRGRFYDWDEEAT